MRSSRETVASPHRSKNPLKDERAIDWSPQRLSDRKLVELQHRLDRLATLGGAFADLRLSPHALQRLTDPEADDG